MQLEYLQPEQLQLRPNDVPKKGRWPHIRAPSWPFNAQLVRHLDASYAIQEILTLPNMYMQITASMLC